MKRGSYRSSRSSSGSAAGHHRSYSEGMVPKRASESGSVGSKSRKIFSKIFKGQTNEQYDQMQLMDLASDGDLVSAARLAEDSLNPKIVRYEIGDKVLICNHKENYGLHVNNLVNRWGFPRGKGTSYQEQNGPYVYVLATVTKIHYEEIQQYYTVKRADNNELQRSDHEFMEIIRPGKGLDAAIEAATKAQEFVTDKTRSSESVLMAQNLDDGPLRRCCRISCLRLSQFCRNLSTVVGACCSSSRSIVASFLDGMKPFRIEFKVSTIEILLLCHIWFMFIDLMRLSFLPPDWDRNIAVISFGVWIVMVVELIFEVFVWPTGYFSLLKSKYSHEPTLRQYIDMFHLFFETVALIIFIPEFLCLWSSETCGADIKLSLLWGTKRALVGPSKLDMVMGNLVTSFVRLRTFGMIRHLKNHWLQKEGGTNRMILSKESNPETHLGPGKAFKQKQAVGSRVKEGGKEEKVYSSTDDLNNASNVGTALLVVNSNRFLLTVFAIVLFLPALQSLVNEIEFLTPSTLADLLQENNQIIPVDSSNDTCSAFNVTKTYWLQSLDNVAVEVLYGQIEPERNCPDTIELMSSNYAHSACLANSNTTSSVGFDNLAKCAHIRPGEIFKVVKQEKEEQRDYGVTIFYNIHDSMRRSTIAGLILQIVLQIVVLVWLSVLKDDTARLVLVPLRQMLKTVSRYVANPLDVTSKGKENKRKRYGSVSSRLSRNASSSSLNGDDEGVGKFETEQLIFAFSRITDLLRKCWGVAGADIISTNLARTEDGKTVDFNPLVPGKCVHALFAFAGINGWAKQLRALESDIMILINDVANVLHGEVARWSLEGSGQCNKNLGAAFLMVFRIGLQTVVQAKLDEAKNVVFSTKQAPAIEDKKKDTAQDNIAGKLDLPLASLPGISAFVDRALIGLLKTFAGIYRDKEILKWKNDFRLGAGVGAFSIDMIFGMDAGWAVEGAVGSEHKIDATYLGPHVNMAARMMSASKQFGVSILLSEAVHEILSDVAKSKLRHIDTVTVKGSSEVQRIFTYDARHKGVDFFLFARRDAEADKAANNYSQAIWDEDQDLKAMRQHVTPHFLELYNAGRDEYLAGNWENAVDLLKKANDTMVDHAKSMGYLEYDLEEAGVYHQNEDVLQREIGDGPSRALIGYMERRQSKAPSSWKGYRPLMSK